MPLPPPVDDDIELNPPAGSERDSSSWQGSWAELWQASEGQQAPCHGTGQTSLQAARATRTTENETPSSTVSMFYTNGT